MDAREGSHGDTCVCVCVRSQNKLIHHFAQYGEKRVVLVDISLVIEKTRTLYRKMFDCARAVVHVAVMFPSNLYTQHNSNTDFNEKV